jgi:Amt family ammonium transporter
MSILCVVCLIYFAIGSGLSNEAQGGFYGTQSFFMKTNDKDQYELFIIGFVSCWYCVSIATASFAERTFLGTHIFIAILIAGILHPIANSWVWGDGWLF